MAASAQDSRSFYMIISLMAFFSVPSDGGAIKGPDEEGDAGSNGIAG